MSVKSCLFSASLCLALLASPALAVVAANPPGGNGPGGGAPAPNGGGDGDPVTTAGRSPLSASPPTRGLILSDDICTGGKLAKCDDSRLSVLPKRP